MSEQDLFAAETAAEVRETASHFDALHHTEEELPGSFAAKAAISDSSGQQAGAATASSAATAGRADKTASGQPPAPTRAEGPAPAGSPMDLGVGPVSGCPAKKHQHLATAFGS